VSSPENSLLADDNSCVRNAAVIFLLGLLTPATSLLAQRAIERGADVIYEDAARHQTNLGAALSPVLTKDGKVALIRGQSVRLRGNVRLQPQRYEELDRTLRSAHQT
jgi:hypothetical protein